MTEARDFKFGECTLYEDYNLQTQKQVKEPNLTWPVHQYLDGDWGGYRLKF